MAIKFGGNLDGDDGLGHGDLARAIMAQAEDIMSNFQFAPNQHVNCRSAPIAETISSMAEFIAKYKPRYNAMNDPIAPGLHVVYDVQDDMPEDIRVITPAWMLPIREFVPCRSVEAAWDLIDWCVDEDFVPRSIKKSKSILYCPNETGKWFAMMDDLDEVPEEYR